MNQHYQEIHPPNRFILRWLDRLALPLAGIVSISTVFLSLWFTPISGFVLFWAAVSFLILLFWLIFRIKPGIFLKSIEKMVQEGRGGLYLWIWVTILFLVASSYVDIVNLIALYPQFTLPFALFITRTPKNRSLTPSVLTLTLFTAIVLGVGSWLALSYNYSLLQSQNVAVELDNVLSIGSIIIWATFGPLIMYYSVRRSQLSQIRVQAIQQTILHLLEIQDPLISAKEVVKMLKERAGIGERVILLSYDQNTDTVKVNASTENNEKQISGYEIPKGLGITRRAINTLTTQYVRDVTKDPDYISGGLPEKGSEVSVPIITSLGNVKHVIGTLNIQETAINAFTDEEINTIEIFSKMIANFTYGYSEYFEQILNLNLEKLSRYDDPDEVIYQVINGASLLFENPLICYYRLAVGTGMPLRPCYIKGNFEFPEFFSNPNLYKIEGNLIQWVCDWEPIFIRYMKSDDNLLKDNYGFGIDFQDKEGASSMCFLPIGSRDYKIGAILLFFKTEKMFSKSETINMRGFAREVWPHIAKAESVKSIMRGFAQPKIHFHSTMAETGLGRGTWETIFRQVESSDQISSTLKDQIIQIRVGLKAFLDKVRALEATQIFQLGSSDFFSLKGALQKACGDLQQRFGIGVIREIDNSIDAENEDLKHVIYILVTEAIRNAFIHGKTVTRIYVKISRLDDHIEIRVADDGIGFDPQTTILTYADNPTYINPGSILDLDILGQQLLGADPIDWLDTAPDKGTRLLWKIPLIGRK